MFAISQHLRSQVLAAVAALILLAVTLLIVNGCASSASREPVATPAPAPITVTETTTVTLPPTTVTLPPTTITLPLPAPAVVEETADSLPMPERVYTPPATRNSSPSTYYRNCAAARAAGAAPVTRGDPGYGPDDGVGCES